MKRSVQISKSLLLVLLVVYLKVELLDHKAIPCLIF